METQRVTWMILVGMVVLLIGLNARPAGTGEANCPGVANFGTAQRLLQSLYPEITGHGYTMAVTMIRGFDSEFAVPPFDVEVGPAEPGHWDWVGGRAGGHAQRVVLERVLTASFEFDEVGMVRDITVLPNVMDLRSKNERIRELVNKHPQWSDQEVAAALKRAGAKCGPDDRDALLKAVPLRKLAPFVGELAIESAEFRLRHQQPPTPIAELYWVVDAPSKLQDGRTFKWEILLEPFEGKLIDLTRFPSPR